MPTDVSLRLAKLTDLPFIQQVFREVLPLYSGLMPGTFEGNIETLDQLIASEQPFSVTGLSAELIEVAGLPQGFLAWAVLDAGPVYLASLHFLASARRQGLGGQALALWEQTLKERGFRCVYLLAHREATWAVNFYLKQGYAVLAEEPSAILALTSEQIEHLLTPGLLLIGKTWELNL
jgi:ribosomal protein S18 acetylase RimI-like enzyme